MTTVLLVSKDPQIARPIVDELYGAGDDVMWCCGPQGPDFACAAGRSQRCPYSLDADVVVVDGWLASDQHREGIASWRLIDYYSDLGLPLVALLGPDVGPSAIDAPGLVTLPRRAPADAVVKAVGSLRRNAAVPRASRRRDVAISPARSARRTG